MRKHTVMLSALVAAFASFAAPFTDGGVTYTPNDEVSRRQPVVTGVNVTGMVESVAYTKGEVDRRIETNAPVRSVNGMRGNVKLGAREVGALPDNRAYLEDDANFVNAVRNVQVKSGDSERVLPPYLHEIEFDSTYPDDAKWYYGQADYSNAGMCSVRRTGGIVERNYDWKFDFMPEFVVRTVAAGGRFASIGVANIGDLLTEADVSKGWSPYYRCLPGHMTDGVNESGVFVEVNVVDGEPDWGNPGGDIHPLGAVRWVLDYGTNAQQAAEALASRIVFPAGWSQNFHYLVADESSTYIVENGASHEVSGTAVMTNFKLYPSRDTDGSGQERYDLLAGGEPITNAWWTLAYLAKTSPVRVSDIGTDTNAVFAAWGRGDRESHRGQSVGGQTWWQTVHTAVYDIGAKSLRICVQEKAEWYEFVLHTGGGKVKSVNGKDGDVSLNYEDVGAWDGRYEVAAALALGYHGRNWLGGTPPYSLRWNSTEKRYRAQWAVGDIPTYEWLAYLSDLDGIDGMTDNAAVLTNGTLKTKGGTAITAANVGAVGTNEYWKVQKGGEGGIGVKLGSAGTYSTFFVGYNNFGEVQNGAHWQYASGGYEDFFSGSVLRMLTGSQFWWLTGSKPWLQTDTDFHIGGGAYGGGKTLPKYVDDRIDAKATGYVPNTRQVNGHPLSADITLSASDVGAISEEMLAPAVSRVKDLHYDAGLSVTWTNIVDNGHIYYVTVTNTNIVTP